MFPLGQGCEGATESRETRNICCKFLVTSVQEREKKAEGLHQAETSFTELHKRYYQMRQLMVIVWQREKSLTQHNQELQAKIQEIKAETQE
ncbi:hypothetical protein EB796_004642 [Bugula neritina]|uniref:Uncharacterized protein n=1 Tax=Bugula neritina TaxID=10212 RepID=A0A7J7KFK3_BUGNE|nr:hypothetical protein EB796_004642 [Bugula neritina]